MPNEFASRGIATEVMSAGYASSHLQMLNCKNRTLQKGQTAKSIYDDLKPDVVIIGTSENKDTMGLLLIEEAKTRSIPTIGAVDGPAFSAHRFRGKGDEPLSYAPDWILTPDDTTRDEYIKFGHPNDKALSVGHPHFDGIRNAAKRLDQIGRKDVRRTILGGDIGERSLVVFASQISDGFEVEHYRLSKSYTLIGRGESVRRTNIVLEEVIDALKLINPKPYLSFRLAPKNAADEFAAYLCEVDHISQYGSPFELIYAADLVIGLTSMLIFEAAIMDRPTIAVLPIAEQARWLKSISLGLTRMACTRSQLKEEIDMALTGKLQQVLAQEVILFGASKRVCDLVENIVIK